MQVITTRSGLSYLRLLSVGGSCPQEAEQEATAHDGDNRQDEEFHGVSFPPSELCLPAATALHG